MTAAYAIIGLALCVTFVMIHENAHEADAVWQLSVWGMICVIALFISLVVDLTLAERAQREDARKQ